MSLRTLRQALLEQQELQGEAFCRAYSDAADHWLGNLLGRATDGDVAGLALLAVGGYGRAELCPYSDLDVVLVHDSRRDVDRIADAIWYPVWDEGIRLDHSVRRPGEVIEVARADLRAQLGLLEGRLVAGDPGISVPLLEQTAQLWRTRTAECVPALAQQVSARRQAHGDVAFLLEPDLKEAHGGLRDLHAFQALNLALPALAGTVDLGQLDEAASVLLSARVELHRSAGRGLDRLLLQEQDQVATSLGYGDADKLMAAIAEAVRSIAWLTDDTWRRWEMYAPRTNRSRRRKGRSGGPPPSELVEPGISIVNPSGAPGTGEVTIADTAGSMAGNTAGSAPLPAPATRTDARMDPGVLMLRLVAVAAERSLPIARDSLSRLASIVSEPSDPWPADLRVALVRALAAGPPAIDALEAIDQWGLLVRILPEWQAVRNRPQRNAYHRFTVDRHLLETAAGAAMLTHRVARPDLLLVASVLHDIGKGFPGDHTEVGIDVVRRIATRMGFPPPDIEALARLVRDHLLLADLATRRDIDDPATVQRLVTAVETRDGLELLAALTEADSLATGPAAWGPWKAGLVSSLVGKAAAKLGDTAERDTGVSPATLPGRLTDPAHQELLANVRRTGRPALLADGSTVTVVAFDRPGLLTAVTGVLALKGLNVRSADVSSYEDLAVEVFVVEPARGRWPDWPTVASDIHDALAGTLALDELLAERRKVYGSRRRTSSPRPVDAEITVDNAASALSTVVEVRAEDAVGLLHHVTRALFDCDVDIVAARVATIGHEVVDAFYVRDSASGGKATDPALAHRIERAVRSTLHSVG